jgi:hypothetical protein
VRTSASFTSRARTQPVTPFGRIGSATCSQVTRHRLSSCSPTTPKTIGARFTLRSPNRAIGARPGERKAFVGRTTNAAYATVAEPTGRCVPAAQVGTIVFARATPCAGSPCPAPQPATTAAAASATNVT